MKKTFGAIIIFLIFCSCQNNAYLAEFEKNERFKIDELGIITEQLLQGDDGLYILGTRVYEKTGPIVKLIKT